MFKSAIQQLPIIPSQHAETMDLMEDRDGVYFAMGGHFSCFLEAMLLPFFHEDVASSRLGSFQMSVIRLMEGSHRGIGLDERVTSHPMHDRTRGKGEKRRLIVLQM